MDAVSDEGRKAAAGTAKGGIGGGGEHLREAGLAEAMAAVEEERGALLLVVARMTQGAAGHPHGSGSPLSTSSASISPIAPPERGFLGGGEADHFPGDASSEDDESLIS